MAKFKNEKSRALFGKAKKIQAGGTGSTQRSHVINVDGVPTYMKRGKGSKIYDVDGNEYIDYYLNYGPLVNGHAHPNIVRAIKKYVENGTMFGLNNELEIKLCEKIIKHVPCAEMVGYHSSGSEAVHTALRLARAYTGKNKIIKFEGQYHGWFDDVLVSAFTAPSGPYEHPKPVLGATGQPKSVLQNVIVLPWNNAEILEKTVKKHAKELASVIMEPIELGHGLLPTEGYLETAREITEKHGVVLIFDEVKTLFRVGLGGAQKILGVKPDLFTCSKAMGGGLPISAYGGKKEIIEIITQGKAPAMGTYNASPIALAGALANVEELERNGGMAYKRMYKVGEKLMEGIKNTFERCGINGVVKGLPVQFVTGFTSRKAEEIKDYRDFYEMLHAKVNNPEKGEKFRVELIKNGVFSAYPDWHLSTVHSESDVDKTLKAVETALKRTF